MTQKEVYVPAAAMCIGKVADRVADRGRHKMHRVLIDEKRVVATNGRALICVPNDLADDQWKKFPEYLEVIPERSGDVIRVSAGALVQLVAALRRAVGSDTVLDIHLDEDRGAAIRIEALSVEFGLELGALGVLMPLAKSDRVVEEPEWVKA